MVSERLRDFLLAWCNPDSDLSETAEMLHRPRNTDYREWLPREYEIQTLECPKCRTVMRMVRKRPLDKQREKLARN